MAKARGFAVGIVSRHSFFPFFEGLSTPTYTKEELDELNAPKYEYNGRKLTEEEANDRQRYIERQIRRWKRENAAMKAAGLDGSESAAKIHQWQERQRDFLRQTGLKRQWDREQLHEMRTAPGPKVVKRAAEARASDFFTILGPEKGDAIQAKSIFNALQRSEVGQHTFKYIKEHGVPVLVHYQKPPSGTILGLTDGFTVEIFARNTRTIKATASTIIHEIAHIENAMGGGQWDEAYCFAQELKHVKGALTYQDLRDIIKTVKQLYPELNWRG